ncbi:MAG: helix-turn-helix domain-containing protein [Pirellulales bacterium]
MLTIRDVSLRLRVSLSLAYQLVEKGALPHHRIGGCIRVSETQLAEYLEQTKREREESSPVKGKPSRPRTELKHLRA